MPTLAGGLVLQETSDLRLRIVKVNDAGQAGGLPNLGVDQHLRGVHEFALQTVGAECDGEAVRAINQQCELICQSMGIARPESVRKCTQPSRSSRLLAQAIAVPGCLRSGNSVARLMNGQPRNCGLAI